MSGIARIKDVLRKMAVPRASEGEEFLKIKKTSDGRIRLFDGSDMYEHVGIRSHALRVATFGDSTAIAAQLATDNQDLRYVLTPYPASGTTSNYMYNEKWALAMFYPQAYLVGNFGIPGQKTTDMIAREVAAASATRRAVADLIAVFPDVVILRGGSINNISSITPATYDAVVATCYAEHCQILQRLLTGVGVVVDEGIFGYSGATTYPDLVRSALLTLNQMFASYAAQYPGRIYMLDTSILRLADGNYAPGVSYDGTHLNSAGGIILGQAEAKLLTRIFGAPSVGPRYKGANFVSNPLMANTTAVAYGIVPTGWSFGATTNCTVSDAKIEVINGETWATCLVTNTAANSNSYAFMPHALSSAGIVVNDIIGGEYKFGVWPQNGAPITPSTFQGRISSRKTGAGVVQMNSSFVAYGTIPASGMTGRMAFQQFQCPEPSANMGADGMYFTFGSAGATDVFKVGVSAARVVNLGQSPG